MMMWMMLDGVLMWLMLVMATTIHGDGVVDVKHQIRITQHAQHEEIDALV